LASRERFWHVKFVNRITVVHMFRQFITLWVVLTARL